MTSFTPARPVIDGARVKLTLEQQEVSNQGRVRCDWLRFTLPVDAFTVHFAPAWAEVEDKVRGLEAAGKFWNDCHPSELPSDMAGLAVQIVAVDGGILTTSALSLAKQGAVQLVKRIGVFQVGAPEISGMDFYAARCPLMYEGVTVGYVLAGGRSIKQAATVHFNLFGSACLHILPHHLLQIAAWVDESRGWITRTDLAMDVWSGLDVADVQAAWREGAFDVRGKRPGQREMGSWSSGHSRTFEVGSRGTGKLLRAYEKGDELFGHEAGDPWVRLEVEFRSSHRVIETDVLRRPADFFAGAYPWLGDFVAALDLDVSPQRIPTNAEVKDAHADAAVERVCRWVMQTAGPAIAAVFDKGGDLIAQVVMKNQSRTSRRLRGFSPADISRAFDQVAASFAPASAPSLSGAY